jgi:hypothetical protein
METTGVTDWLWIKFGISSHVRFDLDAPLHQQRGLSH